MRRDEDLFFSSGGGYYSAPPIDLSVVFIAETWIDCEFGVGKISLCCVYS